jgi:hypothetical protein
MTTLLRPYLNRTVTWKREIGRNQFNEVEFSEDSIRVRWQPTITLVRRSDGQEAATSAQVLTTAAVNIGDVLVGPDGRDWPVITVSVVETLAGRESHREVYV